MSFFFNAAPSAVNNSSQVYRQLAWLERVPQSYLRILQLHYGLYVLEMF